MKRLSILLLSAVLSISCIDDLDQYPNIETTSKDVYTSVEKYNQVLAKLYTSYVTKGQAVNGEEDLASNRGEDYMRCYINLQEGPTDEFAYSWLEGDNMADITYMSWDANDSWVSDAYYRIYYTITLANEFLRNANDESIANFSDADQGVIKGYRAEARFLRALSYYHALDLYLNVPFVSEKDPVGAYAPPRYTSAQIFEYIESELRAIESELDLSVEYGRAPRAAAWALLAKLYLNAKTYTETERYTDCILYCNKVINEGGYSLETDFGKLFNADNHLRTNEIIFSFPVTAPYTISWGSTTYLACGSLGNTSEHLNPKDYGVEAAWGNFRVGQEVTSLYSEYDSRNLFFKEGQDQDLNGSIENQAKGYFSTKWTNLKDDGTPASNTVSYGVSIDFPVFRLADVYLMLAEGVVMGGTGSDLTTATQYINELRQRAFGDNYTTYGQVSAGTLTPEFILNERAREFLLECTRRTDLIRHGKFTTADYLWQWKGGQENGVAVDPKYNYYPIPNNELIANPNLSNNKY